MSVGDLLFIASVLLEFFLLVWMAVCLLRVRWRPLRRLLTFAGIYLCGYATALIAVSLLTPRRFLAPGERRCFDDWCVAATGAQRQGNVWIATLDVSSDAKRVRQRALDANAELEDTKEQRHPPCGAPLTPQRLSDELGPGESFRVVLPFCLPADALPAGVVMHHGAFPGLAIIGDDQSVLHPPALARVAIRETGSALP